MKFSNICRPAIWCRANCSPSPAKRYMINDAYQSVHMVGHGFLNIQWVLILRIPFSVFLLIHSAFYTI